MLVEVGSRSDCRICYQMRFLRRESSSEFPQSSSGIVFVISTNYGSSSEMSNSAENSQNDDFVLWNGIRLPPKHKRFCGSDWGDDAFYLQSAKNEVKRLQTLTGMGPESRLLDIGSGQGRLAIGLATELQEFEGYFGIDVHRPSVDWCQRNITSIFPKFRFIHTDFKNERYNPNGIEFLKPLQLPFSDSSFDIIFLYSVFTHMHSQDVLRYLEEMRRVISENGLAYFTVYIEENCEDEAENPKGYLEHLGLMKGALHRVRYSRIFFEKMLRMTGFRVISFYHRSEEVTLQSSYIVCAGH